VQKPEKLLRCAIYTRVSTDAGLGQEFNSLDAQCEAAAAFVKSQAHEGWCLSGPAYSDGGFSGGSLERPALQKLLEAIRSGHIDIVLVYKVDRLTRSLADFAKLIELFDAHGVSFVSITQAFNTTNSMGRLTLNVLLSFAQFEREVTAERIRDKIAASKKNGIWMGGAVPLGYRVENRKLHVVSEEAATVRLIFEQYLELGSIIALAEKLRADGIRTRIRTRGTEMTGGIPFTAGPLTYLLRNRIYLGEIVHKGVSFRGDHAPILCASTFDAVQEKLVENRVCRKRRAGSSKALLLGKLFDDRGNVMTPRHTQKGAKRYAYYTSRAFIEGRGNQAGSVARVAADDIEPTLIEGLVGQLRLVAPYDTAPSSVVEQFVERVIVRTGALDILLKGNAAAEKASLSIPWNRRPAKPRRTVILSDPGILPRPVKARDRRALILAIAKGRTWLKELSTGKIANIEAIAKREKRSARSINMTLGLAFLAPDLVAAAMDGTLPRGIGITNLCNLPTLWDEQRAKISKRND